MKRVGKVACFTQGLIPTPSQWETIMTRILQNPVLQTQVEAMIDPTVNSLQFKLYG